jgi:hypothetical protein
VVNPFSAADFPGSPDILETLSGPVASKDVLGIRGGVVRVEPAPSGGGDLPYDVNITTSYLPLPPDWGEADDQVSAGWADPPTAGFGRPDVLSRFVTPPGASVTALHDGRPIDLTKAPLASPLPTFAPRRSVTERMAWQHRVSDLDYYNVRVPPVLVRPPGATVCHIEGFGDLGSLGQLFVSGDGIRSILAIAASGSARAFPAEVTTPLGEVMTDGGVGDLTTNLPDGGDVHVIVESHVPGRRGFYRFTASWQDARYYTDEQCRQQIEGLRKAVEWYQTFHGFQITEDQWIRNRLGSGGRPTGTDAPSNPPFVNVLAYTAIGAFEPVWLSTADPVDVIALSPSDESIDEVRLYDATGVLVHSSTPTDVSSAVRAGPAGLVPRARLTATNLDVGFYTLQILSSGQAAGGPVKSIYVGVSQVR